MANTPARVRQADVARCIRAARQAGAEEIQIRPDGTIVVRLTAAPGNLVLETRLDDDPEVVL